MTEIFRLESVTVYADKYCDGKWEVGYFDKSNAGIVSTWSGAYFDTFESAFEDVLSRSFFSAEFQRRLMAYAKEVRPDFFKTVTKVAHPVASQMAFDF
ncbi:MAG: hypothetical protein IKE23_05265 [Exiguobacterium sp.]|nr:hypothetical protein [Exiguobacterium sp.]